jgi:hypothetical protein
MLWEVLLPGMISVLLSVTRGPAVRFKSGE